MTHRIDWEALGELQFLLFSRIADSLNAALTGIALSDVPTSQDRPPDYWKKRASTHVSNVLNLFTAWSTLIQYKRDGVVPERALRSFEANVMLSWLAGQLQLSPAPHLPDHRLLHANRETLQEALLLLYSAAFTQGVGVRLELDTTGDGLWFRIRFSRLTPSLPQTFDDLLASFGDHWREQATLFELATARDFIALNGLDLALHVVGDQGEFAFFVPSTTAARAQLARSMPARGESAPAGVLREPTTPILGTQPQSPAVTAGDHSTPVLPPLKPAAPVARADDRPVIPSPISASDAPTERDLAGPASITLAEDITQVSADTLIVPNLQATDSSAPAPDVDEKA